jgi:hypothetical protein
MSYWHFPSLQEGGRFMFRHTVLHYGYVKSTPIFLQQINVFTDIPTYSLSYNVRQLSTHSAILTILLTF